ncbi:hypothetical protein NOLU111490_16680 [Novosphingobium lubricantis]|uniref:Uncharacterized protein n=1 Tax=Sphingobium fontiphilum TaxID=944425 RepID=A0A7W6GS15_9SPHN|nr:hypothetical protein [Novosphingobium sp. CECT 9465]MBB3983659.1 hypothetical protein [Sphingobium fontiphilum]CAH0498415.1 hypothetical protein NVSP9465_03502 [Novosphingobium sp. CECT 9465]
MNKKWHAMESFPEMIGGSTRLHRLLIQHGVTRRLQTVFGRLDVIIADIYRCQRRLKL